MRGRHLKLEDGRTMIGTSMQSSDNKYVTRCISKFSYESGIERGTNNLKCPISELITDQFELKKEFDEFEIVSKQDTEAMVYASDVIR
jgi:hypothetical protein